MPYFKTKKDVGSIVIMMFCLIGIIVSFVAGGPLVGLVSILGFFLLSLILHSLMMTGKLPARPEGLFINTLLLTTDGTFRRVELVIHPERIVCEHIVIPMENLSQVLFEDKEGGSGFGIDYEDGESSARLMFFFKDFRPAHKVRKSVEAIQKAHAEWFAGCRVPALDVFQSGLIKGSTKVNSVDRGLN